MNESEVRWSIFAGIVVLIGSSILNAWAVGGLQRRLARIETRDIEQSVVLSHTDDTSHLKLVCNMFMIPLETTDANNPKIPNTHLRADCYSTTDSDGEHAVTVKPYVAE